MMCRLCIRLALRHGLWAAQEHITAETLARTGRYMVSRSAQASLHQLLVVAIAFIV